MASVSRFLTNKLRLKVNEAKSAVARPEERKFLGFSISNDGSERRIAPKALDKFKGQIRDMTRRTRGFGLQQLIKGHCQSKFYTPSSRTRAGWSSTVFAQELPPRSAGLDAKNCLYLFALTMPS